MKARKIAKYSMFGLCVLVVASVTFVYFASPVILEKVLAHANMISQTSTGKPLTFAAPPSISFMPLGVSFEGLHWGDETSDISVNAKSGHASVRLASIFSEAPEVSEMELRGAVITIRETGARTTLSAVKDGGAGAVVQETQEKPATGGVGPLPVQLKRLVLQDGQFTLIQASGDQVSLAKIHLSLRNIGQGETGEIESDFVASVRKASGEYIEANMAIQGSVRTSLPEMRLQGFKVTLAPVAGLYDKNLGPTSLAVTGSVNLGTGSINLENLEVLGQGARAGLKGEGNFMDMVFAGELSAELSPTTSGLVPALSGVQSVTFKARTEFADNALNITSLETRADKARLDGAMTVQFAPLAVKGNLHCADIDVNAFMKRASEKGEDASSKGRNNKKAQSVDTQSTSPQFAWPQLDVTLTGDTIICNGVNIGKLTCTVKGKDGNYVISPLKAVLDGASQADVKARLNMKKEVWQTSGSIDSLSLATIQKLAAQDFGMTGSASVTWDVTANGGDGDAIMKSATGKGQVILTNVTIAGLTKAIKNTRELASVVLPERIDRIQVPYTLGKGHCRFSSTITSSVLNGRGQGDLNYVGRRIDATAEITTEGVTIPLKINGPLSDISCSVDVEKLLKNMGKGIFESPQKLAPSEGLEKVIPKGGGVLKKLF